MDKTQEEIQNCKNISRKENLNRSIKIKQNKIKPQGLDGYTDNFYPSFNV